MTHVGLKLAIALLSLATLTLSAGCISLAANLIHAVQGNNRPAEYSGLEGHRVAVVCTTDGRFGGEACDSILTNNLQVALNTKVKNIELVRSSEIEQWLNVHRRSTDYVDIGKGVEADLLLAVEVSNLNLMNGPTLYQGQSDVAIKVYEIPSGMILYQKDIPEFTFPATGGGTPVTDTSENKFRSYYLQVLKTEIGGLFYEVDATESVAIDATASRF